MPRSESLYILVMRQRVPPGQECNQVWENGLVSRALDARKGVPEVFYKFHGVLAYLGGLCRPPDFRDSFKVKPPLQDERWCQSGRGVLPVNACHLMREVSKLQVLILRYPTTVYLASIPACVYNPSHTLRPRRLFHTAHS
jgi:hypothetical protein